MYILLFFCGWIKYIIHLIYLSSIEKVINTIIVFIGHKIFGDWICLFKNRDISNGYMSVLYKLLYNHLAIYHRILQKSYIIQDFVAFCFMKEEWLIARR